MDPLPAQVSRDSRGGRLTTGDAVVICSGASRAGQRGTIIKDDGPSDNKPYKVQFRDGETGWYRARQVSCELGRPTCGPKHNAVVRIANGSHRGGQLALIIEDDHSETPYKVRFKDSKTRWYKEAEVHWCSEPEMRSAPRADRADLVSLAKAVGGVAHFVGEGEINQAMGFVADAIKTGDIAVAAGRAGAAVACGDARRAAHVRARGDLRGADQPNRHSSYIQGGIRAADARTRL